ncbi:MAG TPA: hypothetical protein VG097_14875 [Gemmata sp.]|nr:hypothetical protein [Gemmata sp.]
MSTTAPNLSELLLQRVSKWTGRRVQNLTIEVGGGRVFLRGKAKSFHIKQLAQRGVQDILPNAKLVNAIVVE